MSCHLVSGKVCFRAKSDNNFLRFVNVNCSAVFTISISTGKNGDNAEMNDDNA